MDNNENKVNIENETPQSEQKQNKVGAFFKKVGKGFVSVFATVGRWTRRMFVGGSKDLVPNMDDNAKLESPTRLAVKEFFTRPLPVIALVILILMFLFVFIGPYIWPMDLKLTDPLQANVAPNMTMLNVPGELQGDIKDINGFGNFTVGVSNSGKAFIWGATYNNLTKVDYGAFPKELDGKQIAFISAGSDFIIAITTEGKIVGWGNNARAQFGTGEADSGLIYMPDSFINGTIDASKVSSLATGYQASAMILDGKFYGWGNEKMCLNLGKLNDANLTSAKKVVMTNDNAYVLMEDGSIQHGDALMAQMGVSTTGSNVDDVVDYLSNKKVVDIASTNFCLAFVLEDGEMILSGAASYGETDVPEIPAGEKIISVDGGTRHFAAITDAGKVYLWGHGDYGQTELSGSSATKVYLGANQTYLANDEDQLVAKSGLKGYLFGTDSRGRDTFVRLVHGGKMTMTIGAVAVIVSTIIAIIVGCISGYFGGWVDMLLMRITEIFSSLPFLPFAMMLSYVIRFMNIPETTRIFIIMVILGLLSWTGLARMIRAQVLSVRESEYVTAAKAMGVKESRIAFKHILLNVISVILVSVTLDFAGCMLTESSLSYLGFGVQQPQPTWGNMLNGANNSIVIQSYWWQWVFPSLFLAIATISINIIGDALRDILDPKSSQGR